MEEELIEFMTKELGPKGHKILRDRMASLGISALALSTDSDRKRLAHILRDAFQQYSLSKRQLIFSELLKILNVHIGDNQKTKFAPEEIIDMDGKKITEKEYFERKDKERIFFSRREYDQYQKFKKRQTVADFWNTIDKSLSKFELVFNLFWMKAGEAELRGMSHDDVMKITSKSIQAIRDDVEKSYAQLLSDLRLLEEKNIKKDFKFHFDPKEMKVKTQKKLSPDKRKMKKDIEQFWNVIDKSFFEFKELFFESLQNEIDIKKESKSDDELIHKTQDHIVKVWNDIQTEYENLREKLKIDG